MAVKEELKKLQLHFMVVDLGEVEIMENISMEQRQLLKAALLNSGLELMDDKKSMDKDQKMDDTKSMDKSSTTEEKMMDGKK